MSTDLLLLWVLPNLGIGLFSITVGFILLRLMKSVFAVDCRSGSLQLLCEGLRLIRAASPESVGVQVGTIIVPSFAHPTTTTVCSIAVICGVVSINSICRHFPNMTLICLTVTFLLACCTNVVIEFYCLTLFVSSWTIYIIVFLVFWQVFHLTKHDMVGLWYSSDLMLSCSGLCGEFIVGYDMPSSSIRCYTKI